VPFVSQAQRAKFHALVAEGKMDQATLDRWEEETGDADLPEHVAKQPATPPRTRKAAARKPKPKLNRAGRYKARTGRTK